VTLEPAAPEPHDARAFARALDAANRAFTTAEREELEPFSLTPAVFRLLDHVARHATVTPADAADALAVARPTITAWISVLVDAGYVTRSRVDADARRARLEITTAGSDAYRHATDAIRRRHNRMLAEAIDPVAQADLLAALSRVASARGLKR
jgi:DNA-binding MarR family transcriptional regulator